MPSARTRGLTLSARHPGTGLALVRVAALLARLVAQTVGLALYWPWAHHRGTAAFRRALRQAGLPPEVVARLSESYASAASPWQMLHQVMGRGGRAGAARASLVDAGVGVPARRR